MVIEREMCSPELLNQRRDSYQVRLPFDVGNKLDEAKVAAACTQISCSAADAQHALTRRCRPTLQLPSNANCIAFEDTSAQAVTGSLKDSSRSESLRCD
jgi:hypothetical protein